MTSDHDSGSIRQAYDAAGTAWRRRPANVYRRLAEALLDRSPVPLAGARVIDVGAGTGVGAKVALARGAAAAVASDLAAGMLGSPSGPAVVADATALPFADGSFDLVLQCFVLGHLPDQSAGLVEARRVAPAVLASAFADDWAHPAKTIVDEVMAGFGFVVPAWYVAMKAGEDLVSRPEGLRSLALDAGFDDVTVIRVEVPTGVDDAVAMVDWRWGMAHLAPFVATLTDEQRVAARAAAERAVDGLPPAVVPMLALTGVTRRDRG